MRRYLLFLLILGVELLMTPTAAAAAPLRGLTVTPAIQELTLPADGSKVRFVAQLTNSTAGAMTLAVSADDFTYVGQNGVIKFLDPTLNNPHGLAQAIHLNTALIHLAAGQTSTVSLEIVGSKQLAAGGHYAAIVYRQVDPTAPGHNSIGVKPAVTTLLFATTATGGTTGVRLDAPVLSGLTLAIPDQLNLVFKNTGNVQVAVHGVVQLLGAGDEVMGQGVINTDSGLILPSAQRLFGVTLSAQALHPWWPGLYHVRVSYRPDAASPYQQYEQTILYVDGKLMTLGLVILLGCGILMLHRFGPGRFYLLSR